LGSDDWGGPSPLSGRLHKSKPILVLRWSVGSGEGEKREAVEYPIKTRTENQEGTGGQKKKFRLGTVGEGGRKIPCGENYITKKWYEMLGPANVNKVLHLIGGEGKRTGNPLLAGKFRRVGGHPKHD